MVVFSRFPKADTTPLYQRVMTILACFEKSYCPILKCGEITGLRNMCNSLKIQRCVKVGQREKTWDNEGRFWGYWLCCPSPDPYRGVGLGQRNPQRPPLTL